MTTIAKDIDLTKLRYEIAVIHGDDSLGAPAKYGHLRAVLRDAGILQGLEPLPNYIVARDQPSRLPAPVAPATERPLDAVKILGELANRLGLNGNMPMTTSMLYDLLRSILAEANP